MFERTGNEVGAYHNVTLDGKLHPNNTTRCKGDAKLDTTIEDGNDDDIKGLINFIRGEDYFDYDSDCVLKEEREHILGDIYHSEMVIVGAPNAETAYLGANQESYWRSIKGYSAWANSLNNREEVIYVGANDGMLHAFNADNGCLLYTSDAADDP